MDLLVEADILKLTFSNSVCDDGLELSQERACMCGTVGHILIIRRGPLKACNSLFHIV